MIDQDEKDLNKSKWDRKLDAMKARIKADKPQNNMIDAFGRTKSIDDFKGTSAYARYMAMNEKAAKERKGKTFFGGGMKGK